MEEQFSTMGIWLILILLAVVLAGLLGFWIGRSTSQERRLIRELEAELDNRMQELNRYRTAVNHHFDRTATLFAGMAGAYRDLYHHLAESCQELADKPTLERLEDRAGRLLANVPVRDHPDNAADSRGRDENTQRPEIPRSRSRSRETREIDFKHPPRPD